MATYPGQTVIVAQTAQFGDTPVQTTCPNCRNTVTTVVQRSNGAFAYIITAVVCFFCCPCFWIPLVADCAKDSKHLCPSCNSMIGENKRI